MSSPPDRKQQVLRVPDALEDQKRMLLCASALHVLLHVYADMQKKNPLGVPWSGLTVLWLPPGQVVPLSEFGPNCTTSCFLPRVLHLKGSKAKKSMCVCLTLKRQINRQIGGNKGDGSVGGGEQLLHVALFGRRCQPWVSLNQSSARHSAGVKNLVKVEHKNWEITSAASELRGK